MLPLRMELPPAVQDQTELAQLAFAHKAACPGRHYKDIAAEIGVATITVLGWSKEGKWRDLLKPIVMAKAQAIYEAAAAEALRAREYMLETNERTEQLLEIAAAALVEEDDKGNFKLRKGVTIKDVKTLIEARLKHVAVTEAITGEKAATKIAAAKAGATKVIINSRGVKPVPVEVD